MATGLRLVTERAGDAAGLPVFDVDNGEELMHLQPGVSIVLSDRSPESPGTLYISTKQVVWLSDLDREKGYAVDFMSVALHAVSRDPEAYPYPCIYAQIETGAEDDALEDSDSESNETLNLSKITEMRLVPSDPSQSEEECHNWIFSADQLEDEDAEPEDPHWFVSQDSIHSIGANGNHDLVHSVVQLQINDQRFEDAEEMEHDDKIGRS